MNEEFPPFTRPKPVVLPVILVLFLSLFLVVDSEKQKPLFAFFQSQCYFNKLFIRCFNEIYYKTILTGPFVASRTVAPPELTIHFFRRWDVSYCPSFPRGATLPCRMSLYAFPSTGIDESGLEQVCSCAVLNQLLILHVVHLTLTFCSTFMKYCLGGLISFRLKCLWHTVHFTVQDDVETKILCWHDKQKICSQGVSTGLDNKLLHNLQTHNASSVEKLSWVWSGCFRQFMKPSQHTSSLLSSYLFPSSSSRRYFVLAGRPPLLHNTPLQTLHSPLTGCTGQSFGMTRDVDRNTFE